VSQRKKKEKKASYLAPPAKLLMTSVRMIASTATVTINDSHVDAIGVIASLVLLIANAATLVTPDVWANLSNTRTPTPKIIPTNTSRRTN
jgi:hypothetical protein